MIASVLLEEMYYILKGERAFDEVQYESNLRKMNRKTLNPFSVPNVTLEIETQFKDRCEEIWNAVEHEDEAAASTLFLEIWPEIKEYIVENLYRTTATGVEKATLADVASATEYEVELEALLSEIGIVLLNMHRYEECISFSQDVLELFSWENDDPDIFKINIGDALAGMDRMDECDAWYENWLKEEPENGSCINAYAFTHQIRGDLAGAKRIIEEHRLEDGLVGLKYDNFCLRAAEVYSEAGETEKTEHYAQFLKQSQQLNYKSSWDPFDDGDWKQKPVVKEKLPGRNDPCPCGSGKKYKKCCGK